MIQTVFPQKYNPISLFTRKIIVERDGYTCQNCRSKLAGKLLEVHHKIPVRKGGTDAFENLITLCRKCHKIIEPSHKLNYAIRATTERSIKVRESTFNNLAKLAKYNDSMDDIINRLLEQKKQKKEVNV